MSTKKQTRAAFRRGTFERDGYCCVVCGKPGFDRQGGDGHAAFHPSPVGLVALDAHHVTPREGMPFGGYVPENGATLCDDGCHAAAEAFLKDGAGDEQFRPATLYRRIGSDRGAAERAGGRLGGR